MRFHKLDRAKDKNLWSVRVSTDIRLIVHKTDASLLLCYVNHHDKAYQWAERRRIERHPKTGAMQIVEIREKVLEIEVLKYVEVEQAPLPKPALLADVPDETLLSYGVPAECPTDHVESRRSFPLLLSLIEAVALLHQLRRSPDPNDVSSIEAEYQDCCVAARLLAEAGEGASLTVGGAAQRLYKRLQQSGVGDDFTTEQICEHEEEIADPQTIRKHVRVLAEAGYLERVRDKRGKQPAVYRFADRAIRATDLSDCEAHRDAEARRKS